MKPYKEQPSDRIDTARRRAIKTRTTIERLRARVKSTEETIRRLENVLPFLEQDLLDLTTKTEDVPAIETMVANSKSNEITISSKSPITDLETSIMALTVAQAYVREEDKKICPFDQEFLKVFSQAYSPLRSSSLKPIDTDTYKKIVEQVVEKFLGRIEDSQRKENDSELAKWLIDWIRRNVKNYSEFCKKTLQENPNAENLSRKIDLEKNFSRVLQICTITFHAASQTQSSKSEVVFVNQHTASVENKMHDSTGQPQKKRPPIKENPGMEAQLKLLISEFYTSKFDNELRMAYTAARQDNIEFGYSRVDNILAIFNFRYLLATDQHLEPDQMASARKTIKRLLEEQKRPPLIIPTPKILRKTR